jgi:hypothetical protein
MSLQSPVDVVAYQNSAKAPNPTSALAVQEQTIDSMFVKSAEMTGSFIQQMILLHIFCASAD